MGSQGAEEIPTPPKGQREAGAGTWAPAAALRAPHSAHSDEPFSQFCPHTASKEHTSTPPLPASKKRALCQCALQHGQRLPQLGNLADSSLPALTKTLSYQKHQVKKSICHQHCSFLEHNMKMRPQQLK